MQARILRKRAEVKTGAPDFLQGFYGSAYHARQELDVLQFSQFHRRQCLFDGIVQGVFLDRVDEPSRKARRQLIDRQYLNAMTAGASRFDTRHVHCEACMNDNCSTQTRNHGLPAQCLIDRESIFLQLP